MFEAATTLFIAVVSAWVTVQLSLRRFRTERWWERKVEAYERVIAVLYDAKASANDRLEAVTHCRELSDETQQELSAQTRAAHKQIARAIELGAFLLSDEAQARLTRYLKEDSEAYDITAGEDWIEVLHKEWWAIHDALRDFIPLAKKDLQIYGGQTWPNPLRLAAILFARTKRQVQQR
jgi:hypothetical protein